MNKKKATPRVKKFVELSTGRLTPFVFVPPICPTEPVKCHRLPPSRKKLNDCPVDVAGQCSDALAFREQSRQLSADQDAVRSILAAVDVKENLLNTLDNGHDADIEDEAFFLLLRNYGLNILFCQPGTEKMLRWMSEKRSQDKETQYKAIDSLKRVGTELAHIGHQREDDLPGEIATLWTRFVIQVKKRTMTKIINPANFGITLREILLAEISLTQQEYIPSIVNKIMRLLQSNRSSSNEIIADAIVAALYNLKPGTVRQYRKEAKILPGVYRLK